MAFIKYQVASGISKSSANINLVWEDIKDILEGTITAASGFNSSVCNTAGSVFRGTVPTSYYSSVTKNTNTSSSSDNTLTFSKKHSDMTAYRKFFIYDTISGTYDLRCRMADASSSNLVPTSSTSGYTLSTSSNYNYDFPWNQSPVIHMWISDSIFLIQFIYGAGLDEEYSVGMFDLPASDFDTYAYSSDTDTCPTICIANYCTGGSFNTTTAAATNANQYLITNSTYLGPNDVVQNATAANGSYSDLANWHDTANYLAIYPPAVGNIQALPLATGSAHQRIPVYTVPMQGGSGNFAVNARLKDFYRTTDDFASSGTLVSYDGVEYAVYMSHKTGGATLNDTAATENSCYLIPTGA